ncbi:MarR family winged helix-turn-helix transcriptional regulator [Paenibacillus lutimineralis]|uniref:MarR family winged helix-turn-helix transcriptional regulator n=1 Tax=Paenibacillus lutimineralis TaxID=2707005 RepID=UPI003007A2E7
MILLDKALLFQKFVKFTTSVHQLTHEITMGVREDTITPLQYSILEYVAVTGLVTPSQISDCLYISLPNTSREIKKLAQKGLCEKYTAPEDRRMQYIRLTDQGEVMMNKAFATIEARFWERAGHMSAEELAEIEQAIELLKSKVFHDRQPL